MRKIQAAPLLIYLGILAWPIGAEAYRVGPPPDHSKSLSLLAGLILGITFAGYFLSRRGLFTFKKFFKWQLISLITLTSLTVFSMWAVFYWKDLSSRELSFQRDLIEAKAGNVYGQLSVANKYAQIGRWPTHYSLWPDYTEAYFWMRLACNSDNVFAASMHCEDQMQVLKKTSMT